MIVLTGMPGCGKSTVAEKLGALTSQPVLDTDEILDETYGDVLGERPWDADWRLFRDREREVVRELTERRRGVLALGGGTWMDAEVRRRVSAEHFSVYLRCSIETLVARNRGGGRAMFRFGDPRSRLQRLLEQRSRQYELADLVLPMDDLSADVAAARIAGHGSADAV